ncbi:uncharacterized protein LOC129981955 [Argiope bruennichi]|uniref:uncharacterized protein LOC129981955 n=1 Tax=Argiope bruennichi TaxID=94029 RepID=UPI0024947138|nr:uncharacterized protein LOC129981955 [Argiope bruennichi]
MASAILIAFLIIYSASTFLTHHALVGASPPIEEATKLKEKIKKGTKLLEELNIALDSIKENIKKGIPIDKKNLDKLIEIKDRFKNLQVDPTDLSKELLENFKDRTLEAFSLILQGLNMGPMPALEKLEAGSFEDRPPSDEL